MRKCFTALRGQFSRFIGVEGDKNGSQGLFYLFVAALSVTITIFIAALVIEISGSDLGTFGDFVGGTLNPILTFLTFMGLLITIVLQQTELQETRAELSRSATALESQLKALDRQNFEATFFKMLALHNTIVNAMDVHRKSSDTLHGRDCFRFFFTSYKSIFEENTTHEELNRIKNSHIAFWKQFQQDLAHYYRYLYNLIRFIDESEVEKVRYMRIVRAQLSDYELLVLFYNGLTPKATKFKAYIETYGLFDNLASELLIDPSHLDFYEESAFDEEIGWRKFSHKLEKFLSPKSIL
jgi:hypothetical protein